jgi:hypothetical protein
MTEPITKTGTLRRIGQQGLGLHTYEWYQCVNCNTDYPYMTQDDLYRLRRGGPPGIYCNGVAIHLCPFCRPKEPESKKVAAAFSEDATTPAEADRTVLIPDSAIDRRWWITRVVSKIIYIILGR